MSVTSLWFANTRQLVKLLSWGVFAWMTSSVAFSQTAILGNGQQALVFPSVNFLPGQCPSTLPVTAVADSLGNSHGVGFYGSDFALVSYFGESKIKNIQLSTAATLNTIDTTAIGYLGRATIAVAPSLDFALAADNSGQVYVFRAPFSAPTVTSLPIPGIVGTYQTQAIVFNNASRAFIVHSGGISVMDPPYLSVAFTIPRNYDSTTPVAIAITPDGSKLLASHFSIVDIFTAPFSTASTPVTIDVPFDDYFNAGLDGIAITPDGTRALVVNAYLPKELISIAAPFTASSTVDRIQLPVGLGSFEDISISYDGQYAMLTGSDLSGNGALGVVRAPFTKLSATACAIPVAGGRGSGAVRFLPPALQPPVPPPVSGVSIWPLTGLVTHEFGTGASFSVMLDAPPTADVTVAIVSNNTAEGSVTPASLTFTPANWNVVQIVTISGVDDALRDGDASYTIGLSASSTDTSYNSLTLPSVSVTNIDAGAVVGVSVVPLTTLQTSEAGGAATFSMVLSGTPTANVIINIASSNTAEGIVSPSTLTFTPSNWHVAQTVTVTGVDDAVRDGKVSYEIRFTVSSADSSYNGFPVAPINAVNADNDIPDAPTGLLNDTGQTLCANASNVMGACDAATTGDASTTTPRQDGRFGRDAANSTKVGGGAAGFDFTKMCFNGAVEGTTTGADTCTGSLVANVSATASSTASTDWACTKDNVTNLIWSLQHGRGDWTTYAQTTLPAQHNSANFGAGRCGFSSGWRLPTRRELMGIVYERPFAPMIDFNYFPTYADYYWTGDASLSNASDAWYVYFGSGASNTYQKIQSFYVRLVRSGQ